MTTTTVDPFALVGADDPYPDLARLRRAGPVQWAPDRQVWLVTGYDEARHVMVDATTFTSEAMAAFVVRPSSYDPQPVPADQRVVSIIGTDGETHQRLRRIVNRGFTPARVEPLRRRMREVAAELAPRGNHDAVDIQASYADVLPAIVIAEMLGVDRDLQHEFHRWSAAMMVAVFGTPDGAQANEVTACLGAMATWLDQTIAERQHIDGEDLISVLLRAESVDDALTHDELRTFVFTLMVAGSITTALLIGNGVLLATRQPDVWTAVTTGAVEVADFVEELLRYDPPAQIMLRTCSAGTDLAGNTIEPGSTMAVVLGAANHDERAFDQPDRFHPRRRPVAHLAFGYGPHFCLGAALARLEATVAFEMLAERVERFELVEPLQRLDSEFFRGPSRLVARTVTRP